MKSTLLFIMSMSLIESIYSQEKIYRIIDSQTLLPIEYAHVYTQLFGTITDSQGKFRLNLNDLEDSLQISHLNYAQLKISKNELAKITEIKLIEKENQLDEVVIYSIKNILNSIIENLRDNYIDFPANEFFLRLVLLKNNVESQVSEGYVNVMKSRYFDRTINKSIKIDLLAHNKRSTLENVKYNYYSYEKLFELSESFINLKNDYYNFSYINIDEHLFKISFNPKGELEPYETIYNGHLIIDKNNYAIHEFKYCLDPSYEKYLPEIEIETGIYKKDISTSRIIKWSINPEYNKYELSYMLIEDIICIDKDNKRDRYKAIYELQNLGCFDRSDLPKNTRRLRPNKNIFEYPSFNIKSNIWEIKGLDQKNEEQGNRQVK